MSLLLVILLIVFGPFTLFIWRMLRFTRNSVGQNSPRTVRRVYDFRLSDHLFGANALLFVFLLANWMLVTWSYFSKVIRQDGLGYGVHLLFGVIILLLAVLPAVMAFSVWVNWRVLHGKRLIVDPADPDLIYETADYSVRFREEDVTLMTILTNESLGKLQHSFFQYRITLKDGTVFLIHSFLLRELLSIDFFAHTDREVVDMGWKIVHQDPFFGARAMQ